MRGTRSGSLSTSGGGRGRSGRRLADRSRGVRSTGWLRVREASGYPLVVRVRRRCREGVDQADPQ